MFIVVVYLALKAGGLTLWYPTSREKRARCGAPGVQLRGERAGGLTWTLFARQLDPGSRQDCPPKPFCRAAIADP
jgi:hypothetical protein